MKKTGYERQKEYLKNNPWARTAKAIYERTRRSSCASYQRYKNIKSSLKAKDLKFLWFRDNASSMKRPTIDRIDISKDYTIDNCRYIEHRENCSKSWNRKVTDEDVREMQRLRKTHTYKELSKKYGIAIRNINYHLNKGWVL